MKLLEAEVEWIKGLDPDKVYVMNFKAIDHKEVCEIAEALVRRGDEDPGKWPKFILFCDGLEVEIVEPKVEQ